MEIRKGQLVGFFFTVLLGTLLHFTYQWSGESLLVGLFSPINESTWEHLKLLVTPMLLFGVAEYLWYGREVPNFIPVRLLSMLLGMAVIVTAFYTYVGVVGQNWLPADIGVFVLGVAVAYWFSSRLLGSRWLTSPTAVRLGWLGLLLLVAAMVVFTVNPPPLGLFADPTQQ